MLFLAFSLKVLASLQDQQHSTEIIVILWFPHWVSIMLRWDLAHWLFLYLVGVSRQGLCVFSLHLSSQSSCSWLGKRCWHVLCVWLDFTHEQTLLHKGSWKWDCLMMWATLFTCLHLLNIGTEWSNCSTCNRLQSELASAAPSVFPLWSRRFTLCNCQDCHGAMLRSCHGPWRHL